jgi:lauroyl/myristoyl acyltransferase
MITLAEMLAAILLEGDAERVLTNLALAFEKCGSEKKEEKAKQEMFNIATSLYGIRNQVRYGTLK